jgi:hypothetical protein
MSAANQQRDPELVLCECHVCVAKSISPRANGVTVGSVNGMQISRWSLRRHTTEASPVFTVRLRGGEEAKRSITPNVPATADIMVASAPADAFGIAADVPR